MEIERFDKKIYDFVMQKSAAIIKWMVKILFIVIIWEFIATDYSEKENIFTINEISNIYQSYFAPVFYTFIFIYFFCMLASWFSDIILKEQRTTIDIQGKKTLQKEEKTNQEKEIIYIHEAAHILIGKYFNIEIVGYKETSVQFKMNFLPSKEELENNIKIMYAGAIAQKIIFGFINTGYCSGYGSDYELIGKNLSSYILAFDDEMMFNYDEEKMKEKKQKLSDLFYQETYNIITNNKENLIKISEILKTNTYQKETLELFLDELKLNKTS